MTLYIPDSWVSGLQEHCRFFDSLATLSESAPIETFSYNRDDSMFTYSGTL